MRAWLVVYIDTSYLRRGIGGVYLQGGLDIEKRRLGERIRLVFISNIEYRVEVVKARKSNLLILPNFMYTLLALFFI